MDKKLQYLSPRADAYGFCPENALLAGSPTGMEGNILPGTGEDWSSGLTLSSTPFEL